MKVKRWLATGALVALAALALAGCWGGKQPEQAQESAGKKLQLVLDTTANRQAEVQAVAQYLQQVGVDAQVRVWEKTALEAEAKAGTRQAYTHDWGSAVFDPFDLAIPVLKTDDRGNFSHYSNPQVDQLFEKGAYSPTEEGLAAYKKAQRVIYDEAPWIFGYYMDNVQGVAKAVQGYVPAMDNRINLHDVSRTDGKDTLVVGLNVDRILTLDPADYRDRETETVIRNIFDGLVTRTPDGKVVPEIAESWTQPQPNVYKFKLRSGVKFHNGETMRAEDVVFTFERIMSPTGVNGKQSPRLGLLGPLEKVEKVDASTVRFTLKQLSPQFLQLLVHTQIVPQKYLERVGDEEFARQPVGTGPFKFVRGRLNSEVVLERFDGYYGGSRELPSVGPARLRQVIFRMMPEPSTRVASLKASEVQIIEDVPVDLAAELKQDSNVQIMSAQGTRAYMIELNNQVLTDKRVRQALNYAVNWDDVLNAIYQGRAHRIATAFLPSGFGYDGSLQPYPYDPKKARQLLREAGYSTK